MLAVSCIAWLDVLASLRVPLAQCSLLPGSLLERLRVCAAGNVASPTARERASATRRLQLILDRADTPELRVTAPRRPRAASPRIEPTQDSRRKGAQASERVTSDSCVSPAVAMMHDRTLFACDCRRRCAAITVGSRGTSNETQDQLPRALCACHAAYAHDGKHLQRKSQACSRSAASPG